MQGLIDRLTLANPGWPEWNDLIEVVKSLSFEVVTDEHLGTFYTADRPLVFSDPASGPGWPTWLPGYVPALFGLKADEWEMAGGYADAFSNSAAEKGAIFSAAGNDEDLGYPLLDVPPEVYAFQFASSGAQLFINKQLLILYPNPETESFEELATLEDFTRTNIRQALAGETWFEAYANLDRALLD